MTIHLTFGWDREVVYPYMIASLIVENAPRQVVNNKTVVSIGTVYVSEQSFMVGTNTAIQESRDRPDSKETL